MGLLPWDVGCDGIRVLFLLPSFEIRTRITRKFQESYVY